MRQSRPKVLIIIDQNWGSLVDESHNLKSQMSIKASSAAIKFWLTPHDLWFSLNRTRIFSILPLQLMYKLGTFLRTISGKHDIFNYMSIFLCGFQDVRLVKKLSERGNKSADCIVYSWVHSTENKWSTCNHAVYIIPSFFSHMKGAVY